MKAALQLSCEFEEIPEMVEDLLNNIRTRSHGNVSAMFVTTISNCAENHSQALGGIDEIRQELKKMDDRLMDCTSILAGYVKANADLKMGIDPSNPQEERSENAEPPEETND